jgi:hypothetical protein
MVAINVDVLSISERVSEDEGWAEIAAEDGAADEKAADEKAADEKAADEKAADEKAADDEAADEKAANDEAAADEDVGESGLDHSRDFSVPDCTDVVSVWAPDGARQFVTAGA